MSSRSFHDATESAIRDAFINTLLMLRGNDAHVQIGYAARCIAMIAHRSRLVPNLILSFCRSDEVYKVHTRIECLAESVPLMTHLSSREKQDLLWSMFRQFRATRMISIGLSGVFAEAMSELSQEQADRMRKEPQYIYPRVDDKFVMTLARALSYTDAS